jgi:hypothetical protein
MSIFARSLYVSRKNDPHRSSATPAAIFTAAISRSERICSISRKEHLISDSLIACHPACGLAKKLLLQFAVSLHSLLRRGAFRCRIWRAACFAARFICSVNQAL